MLGDGDRFVTWVGASTAAGLYAGCSAFQRLRSTMSKHTSEYEFFLLAALRATQFTFRNFSYRTLLTVVQKGNMLCHC